MHALANLQLPSCKVALSLYGNVESHVLVKMKDFNRSPKERALDARCYSLASGTLDDNRQDLPKVPTKDNTKTTKRLFRVVKDVSESAIHCLHIVTMLHKGLIPNDQVSHMNQLCQLRGFRDTTDRRFMARDGDLKAGMGSATTLEKKGSNPRGGNTQYNLVLRAQVIAEGIIKECLANASSTMKEEDLP